MDQYKTVGEGSVAVYQQWLDVDVGHDLVETVDFVEPSCHQEVFAVTRTQWMLPTTGRYLEVQDGGRLGGNGKTSKSRTGLKKTKTETRLGTEMTNDE